VKGVGEGAVEAIVNERLEKGAYQSIIDVTKRRDLRAANKKAFESLGYTAGLDSFGHHRSVYFDGEESGPLFLEKAMKFGAKHQHNLNSAQVSLFGDSEEEALLEPPMPICEPWGTLHMLNKEKEVVGFYISGHPLDDYKLEMENFCTANIGEMQDLDTAKGKDLRVAGMVSQVEHRFTKTGKPFGTITIEDYHDNITFFLFGEEYPKFKPYMTEGWFLFAQCRVQSRRWKEDELEMKLVSVELLSEIKEKALRSVVLTVQAKDVNELLLERIEDLSEEYKGKHHLKFVVEDPREGYKVELRSKKFKVNLEDAFLNRLKQIPELELQIN
ncbi:MAG: DNA polymerase III subunit alpha, partial [Bacteroidetes bacterium]|nr:DNA polymerase III subunit alpha [Bacteroidota bacterium]